MLLFLFATWHFSEENSNYKFRKVYLCFAQIGGIVLVYCLFLLPVHVREKQGQTVHETAIDRQKEKQTKIQSDKQTQGDKL